MTQPVDSYDLSIISALAEDSDLTSKELASMVHLSRTAAARRIQNLRDRGFIGRPRSSVNYQKLGFSVEATILISGPKSNSFNLLPTIMERPEILSVSVAVGRVLFFADAIFRHTEHMHRFLSWLEEQSDSETHVLLRSHRSEIRVRDRVRLIDEFLATEDARFK